MKKKVKIIIAVWIILSVAWLFYRLTGFFIVQPIGALPEWVTIRYWRYTSNLPFISSPDSISNDTVWQVSLLTRWMVLSKITELIYEDIIAKFPYSEILYLKSTGWISYDW